MTEDRNRVTIHIDTDIEHLTDYFECDICGEAFEGTWKEIGDHYDRCLFEE